MDSMTVSMRKCHKCKTGNMMPDSWYQNFFPGGRSVSVKLVTSVCDNCGTESISTEQQEENLRRLKDRKAHYGSILMGEEIVAFRLKYGLTQKSLAKIFGKGKIAFSRYEKEDSYPNESITKLLNLAIDFPEVLKSLADKAGVEIPLWKERCEDSHKETQLSQKAVENSTNGLVAQLSKQLEAIIHDRVMEGLSEFHQFRHDHQYLIHKLREELEMAQHCYDNMKAEGLSTCLIEAEGYLRAFKTVSNLIKDIEDDQKPSQSIQD